MGKKLELAIAALNGAVGDYLQKRGNGLATEMTFAAAGEPVACTRAGLSRAMPEPSARVAVFVHGLMCTEAIWEMPDGTDYGSLLARDLAISPLFVRYNSGLAIADNGALLAHLLEAALGELPVPPEEIILVGYSMGGLVVRAACHVAELSGLRWLTKVKRAIYVGTPHLGAPLERVGRVVTRVLKAIPDPTTRLLGDLAELRSDGVKDLGDADIRHSDRARRTPSISLRDPRHPVPLLAHIQHYLAAASLSDDPRLAAIFGDVLVPVPSGTDGACFDPETIAVPPSHVRLFPKMSHIQLAHDAEVYRAISAWCHA